MVFHVGSISISFIYVISKNGKQLDELVLLLMCCFVFQAGLIKMGAKFAPCMRSDKRLKELLADYKKKESETGCCVKSDESGCIQTTEKECSVSHVHHT